MVLHAAGRNDPDPPLSTVFLQVYQQDPPDRFGQQRLPPLYAPDHVYEKVDHD
jgi:hypothetical protein